MLNYYELFCCYWCLCFVIFFFWFCNSFWSHLISDILDHFYWSPLSCLTLCNFTPSLWVSSLISSQPFPLYTLLKNLFFKVLSLPLLQFSKDQVISILWIFSACYLKIIKNNSYLFGALITNTYSYCMSPSEWSSGSVALLLVLLSKFNVSMLSSVCHFLCLHQHTESLCSEITVVEFILHSLFFKLFSII